eukprot:scaffold63029_cov72-Phaeocystis_antarctica.AAC.6
MNQSPCEARRLLECCTRIDAVGCCWRARFEREHDLLDPLLAHEVLQLAEGGRLVLRGVRVAQHGDLMLHCIRERLVIGQAYYQVLERDAAAGRRRRPSGRCQTQRWRELPIKDEEHPASATEPFEAHRVAILNDRCDNQPDQLERQVDEFRSGTQEAVARQCHGRREVLNAQCARKGVDVHHWGLGGGHQGVDVHHWGAVARQLGAVAKRSKTCTFKNPSAKMRPQYARLKTATHGDRALWSAFSVERMPRR